MSRPISEFRTEVRSWLNEHVPPKQAPHDGSAARAFVLDWQRIQAEGGWAGISWPQSVGGCGLSVSEQIVWFEEYVRAGAPSVLNPLFVALNHAGPTLIACGTPEQQAEHLPHILNGEVIWCQGFSEPNAGSDLGGLRARGRVEGDQLVINGQKIWSSYADIADWQEMLVRTDPEARTGQALSWVIVPMETDGITVRPIATMAGAATFCEVFYDEVRVPLANVVGGLNNGWATAMSTLGFERGTAALALLMDLVWRVDELLRDCPVARPLMRSRLAELRAEGRSILSMNYRLALESQNSVPDSGGSLVRLAFAEFAQRVSAAAVELYGIESDKVTGFHGWGYEYLHSFSETIAGGTAEIQRDIIAERVLGLPKGSR
ncbi:acyl-CoA dehydrogenase family protein [Kineobactrum salinum]|uniref:Acyl-CoA dehydrogenase n=1 Tax=Kineobactrum salinum TaxID=2708301 RepID=A0A6C0U4J3_9GAMM|nr:acyl-CoA dehydrogenase family protein [Kineobactrum salinum]QIB66848.1 acyl-CoA dehydrogenase [Kineobactrum salinum]